MSLKSPLALASPTDLASFPRELHLNMLTFLRATDLSALQRTCRCFNHRELVVAVVERHATDVYPSELTEGFDTPIVSGEVRSVAVVANTGSHAPPMSSAAAAAPSAPSAAPAKVYTYEVLRNMEMLVVARVLSRPEPPVHQRDACFYVSKSWCRAALRWLEVQEEERKDREERREAARLAAAAGAGGAPRTPRGRKGRHGGGRGKPHPGSSGKKKLSRKEQRQRERRMSDAMPPCPIINNDIVCEHGSIKQCSSKSARARRRVMDKQAWKVLKCLYPDSIQLEASAAGAHGCLICAAEAQGAKKAEQERKEEEKICRKKPLECSLVRGFYTRGSKGYPAHSCRPAVAAAAGAKPSSAAGHCPLRPGVYCALPRSWCHRWRRYIKTGEGASLPAPDASEVLCEAHTLPVVPPHLEAFLRGETATLLGGATLAAVEEEDAGAPAPVVGAAPIENSGARPRVSAADAATLQALRAAGLSEAELHAQRVAMAGMERQLHRAHIHGMHELRARSNGQEEPRPHRCATLVTNEQLDRENRVVVEILTDEEVTALEKWWPGCQERNFALRFAVVENGAGGGHGPEGSSTEIMWSIMPCRECDPSSRQTTDFVMRNRLQKRVYR